MKFRWLKKTRVAIALLFFILTLMVFTDLYEKVPKETVNTILYLQFIPSLLKFTAILSIGTAGFFIVILLTTLTGRFYCSTICPLGILQDVFSYFAKRQSKRKLFYKSKSAHNLIRHIILGIALIALLISSSHVITLLDPYSNAGRIFTYLFRPLVVSGNNLLSFFLQNWELYTFHPVQLVMAPIPVFILTVAVFIMVGYLSFKRGRIICNTICPVGTFLGLIGKHALLKIRFDSSKCTQCGKCSGVCKSECINIKAQAIDYTRCVDCFNCLAVCPENALAYNAGYAHKAVDPGKPTNDQRRKLIISALTLMAGTRLLALKSNKIPEDKKNLKKNVKDFPVSPPGSVSIQRFNAKCTGCGLCITACPTQVLQPALTEYGLNGFMQPHMDYQTGFCNFDCHVCSHICPTGAILPINLKEKQQTQLGKAVFVKDNCIVYTDETDCGACSEHCPTKAVQMVPYQHGLVIPQVDQAICIGCGACEYPCPVEAPFKAIYVNGNAVHQQAQKPKEEEKTSQPFEDDFPF